MKQAIDFKQDTLTLHGTRGESIDNILIFNKLQISHLQSNFFIVTFRKLRKKINDLRHFCKLPKSLIFVIFFYSHLSQRFLADFYDILNKILNFNNLSISVINVYDSYRAHRNRQYKGYNFTNNYISICIINSLQRIFGIIKLILNLQKQCKSLINYSLT